MPAFLRLQVFRCVTWLAFSILATGAQAQSAPLSDDEESAARRPNIVWIMSEDNSKHYLKHFDDSGVEAPAIEAMAKHGVTFDRAFSNAPVCSTARTTLITGCYGPRIGTQFHRRTQPATLPINVEMFPAWLRAAGYYTTNNAKEDYNAKPRLQPWDDSSRKASWRNRPTPDTPFFHVVTFADSHEGRLHFPLEKLEQSTDFDQATVELQPYFPDTKLFRYTAAFYRDRMSIIDSKVADVISQLEQDGQFENTFVFYFGDHGGVLPRGKGYIYESGLHVPLVIRVPDNYRDLVDREFGTRTQGFVSFIDFAPTVLNLAGLDPQSAGPIDGQAFLGPNVTAAEVDSRNTTFGYADRMDEKYDLVRSVRIGDWKLIRAFESFQPDAMWADYRYEMLAYQQWKDRYETGKLNEVQSQFFEPRQPELLFNLADDPHEVNNLADDPQHGDELIRLRQELTTHLKATNDLGFLTESRMLDVLDAPVENGKALSDEIATYIDTANIAIEPWEEASEELWATINSGDLLQRYWALAAASSIAAADPAAKGDMAADTTFAKLVRRRMLDVEPLVAARAAQLSAILGLDDPRPVFQRVLKQTQSPTEALQIFNMVRQVTEMNEATYPMNSKLFSLPFVPDSKGLIQQHLDHLDRP
ncbi:sulfatase-like hydrolase/transferase [Rhodopirellula sp. JC740]|uniref:Sulfatase-like hydrolase/transferase n=1 Tax=Rhodopirellula halodulae TaxID=2894198 RepID=A0ABS8NBH6_9BACT|nr:sulfatase [Rhodopirellula sp. JC740]MCC9640915.1 sulfatase-like hydrolase/transferase [Rhodopirellula sp. JC740]